MTKESANDAYWTTRFAPGMLVAGLTLLGYSLREAIPPLWCISVGFLSGGLLTLFHVLKWRTGRQRFQVAGMAAMFLPMFIVLEVYHPFLGHFVGIAISTYCVGVIILARRIRVWIQTISCREQQ